MAPGGGTIILDVSFNKYKNRCLKNSVNFKIGLFKATSLLNLF
jgi:hypothetical protein